MCMYMCTYTCICKCAALFIVVSKPSIQIQNMVTLWIFQFLVQV